MLFNVMMNLRLFLFKNSTFLLLMISVHFYLLRIRAVIFFLSIFET